MVGSLTTTTSQFQFLIGRLEIGLGRLTSKSNCMFQFLIGRLEILIRVPFSSTPTSVSIPYR